MKQELFYPSADGETTIHAIKWTGEEKPIAVLQIVHGMTEFIDRYNDFATYLTSVGFVVVGNDHLGHGQSVKSDEDNGFFHDKHGNNILLADIHALRTQIQADYADIPYFILGHSMGSFLTRQYIQRYADGLQGAIIMGTGSQPTAVLNIAMSLCATIAAFKGWRYRSRMVDNLAFGSYNKAFKPARTSRDWLTKDNAIVDWYMATPKCMFLFTVNGFRNMFYSIKDCQKRKNIKKIPKSLPIYVVSGAADPVGSFGKGVKKVYKMYGKAKIRDVSLKLFADDRHEILNETDRANVYTNIAGWLKSKL